MQLHDVHQGIQKRKKRKRIGRGVGSGQGKTAGKGHKGHSSRQGFKINNIAEGGRYGYTLGKVSRLCYDKSRHGAGCLVLEGYRELARYCAILGAIDRGIAREMNPEARRAAR